MALTATIHKINLDVANMNLHHYENYQFTLARHPSENEYRMMIKLLGFSLYCQEGISFYKELCDTNLPEICAKNHAEEYTQWLIFGEPDEKRIKQACSRSKKVSVLSYHEGAIASWFEKIQGKIWKFTNLEILTLIPISENSLEDLVDRGMEISCMIDHDEIWISKNELRVGYQYKFLKKIEE